MAGFIRIGRFDSNEDNATSTPGKGRPGALDYETVIPHIQAAVTALNQMPRPNVQAIRNIVRGVFAQVAGGMQDWDALPDSWIAWTAADWDVHGLSYSARNNILVALGEVSP